MRRLVFVVLLAASGLFLISCAHTKNENDPLAIEAKNEIAAQEEGLAPDFKLPDFSGKFHTLSEYRGRQPVLLFFWTTWCPFCQKEIKKISDRSVELANAGIEVLTINSGEPRSRVQRFLQSRKINLKTLGDEDTSVSNSYGILGVPTFYLVDKKGKIIFEGNKFPENYKELISKK
ncbi:MAG: TlpA disulfide reductase family protein [Candidatus Omnitrophota bacterium]|jgi:peroxiredoxin